MIIELLCTPIFGLINFIVTLIPEGFQLPSWISYTVEILKYPLSLIPGDVWVIIISNVSFWYIAHLTWAIIEWILKKIPGIN